MSDQQLSGMTQQQYDDWLDYISTSGPLRSWITQTKLYLEANRPGSNPPTPPPPPPGT